MSAPSSVARVPDSATRIQIDFLTQLAVHIGLRAEDGLSLMAPQVISGPAGLAGRFHLHPEQAAVLPEVLLPVAAQELAGPEVLRLLTLQAAILKEFGWYLGASAEGMLQLSSLSWIEAPQDAATAMDMLNGIGASVLQALLDEPAPAPSSA
ncbi:hypothetical protein [Acidovorax sp. SUPP2539]|uniref:hypothetical protein n=1 Tax=Acidovorax sp. SUPP2539 TaxID=2920878 RepID=UPI0023DE2163|nr:hypothetical protein [Acidovorax sp. SUPP2539]GKS91747.1 hypothetical protein AVTE2539_20300 [Acidovorax sp. SUPP2539]